MKTCGVCSEKQSKYRCPKCHTQYCSLPCFKLHKSKLPDEAGGCNPDAKPTTTNSNNTNKNDRFENKKRRRDHTVEEHAQVSPEDLKRLKTSASILEAVKSAQLQEVVRTILEARDPHKALQSRLEKDPYFSSFADDIMIAIGKAELTPDGHVVVL
jgi:zinc finger HIT domain-containing protein 3